MRSKLTAGSWLEISKLLTACIYKAAETDKQRRDCLVEKISHGVTVSVVLNGSR